MEKVSLYIPCYNAARHIESCLEGVLMQTHPIAEVLIIDDGSTDRTVEIASHYPVKIIRHSTNLGLPSARNSALNHCRSEFLASVDADVVPAPTWLEKSMEVLRDRNIVGVCGKLIEKFDSSLPDRWRAVHMRQHWGDEPIRDPFGLSGSNTVYRASVLRGVGGYHRFKASTEDFEICQRIYARGYHLFYTPEAVCYHMRRDSIRSVLKNCWWWRSSYYHMRESFGLYDLLRKLINTNIRYPFHSVVPADVRERRLRFLFLDILLVLYASYLDVRYYVQTLRTGMPPSHVGGPVEAKTEPGGPA